MSQLKEDIYQLLQQFISIRTVNYVEEHTNPPDDMKSPGQEHKISKLIEEHFTAHHISFQYLGEDKNRQDLFGFIGQNKPGYRKLLLACHMDTVPAGDGWVADAFTATRDGNRVYGRGSQDNKGPLAALVFVAQKLKTMEDKINGQIIIGAVADEEVGLCENLGKIVGNRTLEVTDAIIPDVGRNMKQMVIAEKGHMQIMVVANGKAAHSARPHLGVNAITGMAQFLSAASTYTLKHQPSSLFSYGPTITASIISGGKTPNAVPQSCTAVLSIRYLPSQSPANILKELECLAGEVSSTPISLSVQGNHREPISVSASSFLIKTIQKHSDVSLIGTGGSTVSKQLAPHGVVSVGFGPGDVDVMHTCNEYITLDELEKFVELLIPICLDVANNKVNDA